MTTTKRIIVHALVQQFGPVGSPTITMKTACGVRGYLSTLTVNSAGEQVTCSSCLKVLNNASTIDFDLWSRDLESVGHKTLALIYAKQHVKVAGRDVERAVARLAGTKEELEKAEKRVNELIEATGRIP